MRLFGFDLSIRKAGQVLQNVDDSRGWTTIHDFTPGGFQRDLLEMDPERLHANWAVFACQTLIAGDVGKLGVKLTQWNDTDKIYEDTDSPSVTPFLTKPNHFQTWQKFMERWILSKVSNGNTYVLKERDARKVVVAGYVLDPHRVKPLIAQNGDVFYRLAGGSAEEDLAGIHDGDVIVPASEIIHDRMWCLFHPLVGISPLYACGLAATQGLDIQRHGARFFRNSAMPGVVLTSPQRIEDDLAKRYKDRWDTNFGGSNRGKTAVLGNGLQATILSENAVDSQLVEQLKLSAEMICSVYHVPAYKIGAGTTPTYQNAEVLNQIYYDVCLQPLVQAIEACLDEGLSLPKKNFKVQLDEDDLLRMDKASMMEFIGKGVEKAVFAPNEARRKFNMPPATGGDSPMLQQQMFSLEALSKRDALPNPFVIDRPTANPTPSPDGPAPVADPAEKPTKANVYQLAKRFGGGLEKAA